MVSGCTGDDGLKTDVKCGEIMIGWIMQWW
jgi:hypothetical protein